MIGPTGAVRALALSADGGLLASSSWDHTIRLWETTEGRPIATLEGNQFGCEYAQGFGIAKPAGADATHRLVETWTPPLPARDL